MTDRAPFLLKTSFSIAVTTTAQAVAFPAIGLPAAAALISNTGTGEAFFRLGTQTAGLGCVAGDPDMSIPAGAARLIDVRFAAAIAAIGAATTTLRISLGSGTPI
jgi:hypothetical protein